MKAKPAPAPPPPKTTMRIRRAMTPQLQAKAKDDLLDLLAAEDDLAERRKALAAQLAAEKERLAKRIRTTRQRMRDSTFWEERPCTEDRHPDSGQRLVKEDIHPDDLQLALFVAAEPHPSEPKETPAP